jgi:putative peptide zinc metalloprotease protein
MTDRITKQVIAGIITFTLYASLLSWKLALLLMIGVGFHEMCHLWGAQYLGLKTKGFYFLPFIGGVSFVDEKYKSLAQQAFVALAGPAGGGVLAGLTALVGVLTHQPFLLAAANWMAIMNLFNLLPLSFLDGGQVMNTITYSVNRTFGFVCMVISTITASILISRLNLFLGTVISIIGGLQCGNEYRNWKAYKDKKFDECSEYYLNPPTKMSNFQFCQTMAGWVIISGLILLLMGFLSTYPEAQLSQVFHK